MTDSLAGVAAALRAGATSAGALLDEALARHDGRAPALHAYVHLDRDGARAAAAEADRRLRGRGPPPGPLCGIPVSVKDLYGVDGQPVWGGTARPLPEEWSRDGWLVARLRAQGAVFVGRTITVELAFGAVGTNPHHGTPRNPFDDHTHRIPGGSSAGAGVSLVEGSALVALGTDTGGSIRIPASLSGTVGHKTTHGRWSTEGVVPLSTTLDTVGALTRTVDDAAWFFGAVDPAWGDPDAFVAEVRRRADAAPLRVGRPRARILDEVDPALGGMVDGALEAWARSGAAAVTPVDGSLLDEAERLYMEGTIVAAEGQAFVASRLPHHRSALDPRVAARLEGAPSLESPAYRRDRATLDALAARAPTLFADVDVLAWPTHLHAPPPVDDLTDLDRYLTVNRGLLRPTCPVNALGLCALTVPVGFDPRGLPVGLQLVAPGGADELVLAAGRRLEAVLQASPRSSTSR